MTFGRSFLAAASFITRGAPALTQEKIKQEGRVLGKRLAPGVIDFSP